MKFIVYIPINFYLFQLIFNFKIIDVSIVFILTIQHIEIENAMANKSYEIFFSHHDMVLTSYHKVFMSQTVWLKQAKTNKLLIWKDSNLIYTIRYVNEVSQDDRHQTYYTQILFIILRREKGLIYPSTLSFRADIPLVIKVAHICPYRYTNGSHIPLPLQNGSHIPFI